MTKQIISIAPCPEAKRQHSSSKLVRRVINSWKKVRENDQLENGFAEREPP